MLLLNFEHVVMGYSQGSSAILNPKFCLLNDFIHLRVIRGDIVTIVSHILIYSCAYSYCFYLFLNCLNLFCNLCNYLMSKIIFFNFLFLQSDNVKPNSYKKLFYKYSKKFGKCEYFYGFILF